MALFHLHGGERNFYLFKKSVLRGRNKDTNPCICPNGDRTYNLGVSGQGSNQLSYLAKEQICLWQEAVVQVEERHPLKLGPYASTRIGS